MTMINDGGRALSYRPDITGLRAVAILPILLLHCGLTQLRGGFIGVDIFFVISGYLITTIVRHDIDHARFSLLRFYRHRIVRILPALLVMVSIVLIIGCQVLLPPQVRDLGWSAAATGAFVSNVYFYATADYFAGSSNAKPLIHGWSLAVEEQFYILYPILLWRLRRLSETALIRTIAGIAILSFAIGGWNAWTDPSAGFFLLPARIWELSIGALVALGAMPRITTRAWRTLLCVAAVAAIAVACVVIRPSALFPVPIALVPTVAAAILIAYGQGTVAGDFLSIRPLHAIGRISYSTYLWHRPIIAFYEARYGAWPTMPEIALLVAVSLAAGCASFYLIEQPALRRFRDGRGVGIHLVALATLAITIITSVAIATHAERIRPLPPRFARIASYVGWDRTAEGRRQFSTDRCFWVPNGAPYDPSCLALSATKPNILLMGDSHGAHFSQALTQALPHAHILQATAATCRPLLHGKGNPECRAVVERALTTLDFRRIDRVVLSARWLPFEEPALLETVRYLRRKGVSVLVLGPSTEYNVDLPVLIVRGVEAGDPRRADRFHVAERFALDPVLARTIRAAGAEYASTIAVECPGGRCALTTGGVPLHFDQSHFTPEGARYILRPIVARYLSDRSER